MQRLGVLQLLQVLVVVMETCVQQRAVCNPLVHPHLECTVVLSSWISHKKACLRNLSRFESVSAVSVQASQFTNCTQLSSPSSLDSEVVQTAVHSARPTVKRLGGSVIHVCLGRPNHLLSSLGFRQPCLARCSTLYRPSQADHRWRRQELPLLQW